MNEILNIAISSITVGGVIIFLGKKIIDKGFDAAVKTFENKLDMLKMEHQIKYSKLHEERATILKDLYKELYEIEKALANMTTFSQGPEWIQDDERRNNAVQQFRKCQNLLENNRIFFSQDFCSMLEDNLKDCTEVINNMERAKRGGKMQELNSKFDLPYPEEGKTPLDLWLEQEKRVKTDIRNRRIEMADSFRKMIGVE